MSFPLLALIQLVLEKCKKRSSRVSKANSQLKNALYYRSVITVVQEGYLMFAISVLIGLYNLDFSSAGKTVHSTFTIIFAVLIVVIPVLMIRHALTNFEKLNKEDMKAQYGSLYENLRITKTNRAVLLQPGFFLLRRLILAFAVVVCRGHLIA